MGIPYMGSFFIHLPIEEHLVYLCFLAIISKASLKILFLYF